ncbi:MAG: FAD-dependent oxidoreductase [Bacteroidota bacterium]
MKRRNFIITSSLASLAGFIKPVSGYSHNNDASTKNSVLEEAKEIPVKGVYDVIVCGGGPAGFSAAVSAARNGATVKLIALQGFLGGVWTTGLMTHFIDAENKVGIMRELLEAQNHAGVLQQRYFDVELTKLWLEKMCVESGVNMLYHTRVVGAQVEDNSLKTIITENSNGREAWQAKIFIDATGNGDLATLSGCSYELGHPESGLTQPMSLNALITGIHLKDLQERKLISMPGLSWAEPKENFLAEIRRGGADCSYEKPTLFAIREDFFSLMSNHEYKVSSLDAEEITYATIRARKEINEQINALRSLGGIWKNIRLIGTADQIGIRESRRIHGRYTITKDDLINGSRFEDAVCRVTFHVDIHALDPSKNKSIEKHPFKTKPYHIPLRSLIARDVDGLMMVGRCISGDFFAHASYRVTGNAVAMGEAAGIVSAKAASKNCLPNEVNWENTNSF